MRLAIHVDFSRSTIGRCAIRRLPSKLITTLSDECRGKRQYKMHTLALFITKVLVILVLFFLRPDSTRQRFDNQAQLFERTLNGLRNVDYGGFLCRNVANGKIHFERHGS